MILSSRCSIVIHRGGKGYKAFINEGWVIIGLGSACKFIEWIDYKVNEGGIGNHCTWDMRDGWGDRWIEVRY